MAKERKGNRHAARLAAIAVAASLSGVAGAEQYGLLAGRGGDPAGLPTLSAEIGYRAIEDGSGFVARINYRLDERITLYGDIGSFEQDEELGEGVDTELSGQPFGAGVFYHLPDMSERFDVSLQASYHVLDADGDVEGNFTLLGAPAASAELSAESTEIAGGVLIGGKEPLAENGLRWFATLSYHQIDTEGGLEGTLRNGTAVSLESPDSDEGTGVGYSAGVVLPLAAGEAWAGYEVVDGDGGFGAAFRYFFGD